jgi:hypothetical protein
MVDILPRALSELPEIVFEPERFEFKDGRLELSGRWYGVEGRRFMRPSLTFLRDDGETRLLADLEHKPWAAASGEQWHAAFPCDGELDAGVDGELSVAPDLTVELPIPKGLPAGRDAQNESVKPRRVAEPDHDAEPPEDAQPPEDAEPRRVGESPKVAEPLAAVKPRSETSIALEDKRPSARATATPIREAAVDADTERAQTQALSSARAEIATLRKRLDHMTAELEEQRSRFARELSEAHEATAEAVRSRDEALAMRRKAIEARQMAEKTIELALAVRAKAKKAAERALAEREEAVARLDQALAEREAEVARRDDALSQRDHALTQHVQALEERSMAVTQRDEARAQRDQTVSDLKRVASERDELTAAHEQLRANYEKALTTRGAPLATRHATIESPAQRRQGQWLAVAIPVIALLVVTLAVTLILSSH